jgi:PAS domain S-box-containing protein
VDFLTRLVDTSDFRDRWHCGDWSPAHAWLHILSHLAVWSAYVAIPCVLGYFVLRRRDVPFRTVFWLFGAFILACGTTHLMEALLFWWPAYRLAGLIKLLTAVVSWATVVALVRVTPAALALRSPQELGREVLARKEAEGALERANAELRRQVEALRASDERFRLLVDGTADYAIFMLDPFGRVASWNAGAERIKGYRAEEIVGQHFARFYPPEDVAAGRPERQLRRAAAEGRYEEEGWRLRQDGSRFWASVVVTALRDDAGGLRGFSKITRDMTERKRAEENARRLLEEEVARRAAEEHAAAMREQREWFRTTLASIGDGVITADTEGRVTFLNPVAEALTGWSAQEGACGEPLTTVFRIVNEHTRRTVENPIEKALREGRVVGLANHTLLIARDGTERPIADSAAPIRREDGAVAGVVLVFRDATEERRAAEEARKHREILKLVHQIGKIGHWEWGSLTDENRWSPEMEALYGLPPGSFEGNYAGWARLVHPDDLPRAEEDVRRALQTGEYFAEFRVVWPDGSVHWLETRALVFKDGHDRPVRIMGVNMDVTERKRQEEALREADRRKDEFLATLSHELRNPLAPMRHALQIIRQSPDRAARAEARAVVERQFEQLVRLVDDLLDVSRITRGKLELRRGPVPLAEAVAEAVETARPLIDQMGHRLTVTLPGRPVVVDADLTRLAQVFANLLTNSAKYSDRGGHIQLSAVVEGGAVAVSVKDDGMGIAADYLPRLFRMFAQAEGSQGRAQGGLGIGLTLVKRLAEMHGGSVEARSDGPGKGAEFVVRLPVVEAAAAPAADVKAEPAAPGPPLRVLLVDDNRDGADSLAALLRLMGHEVRVAYDGPEGAGAAEQFRPDVILLDIGLPKLNGYEVCRRVREQPWGRGVFIAALTGWGQDEDLRRAREAGFDEHLVKPVGAQRLTELLAGVRPARPV